MKAALMALMVLSLFSSAAAAQLAMSANDMTILDIRTSPRFRF
jgi:hypothetical protein